MNFGKPVGSLFVGHGAVRAFGNHGLVGFVDFSDSLDHLEGLESVEISDTFLDLGGDGLHVGYTG